jgi:hypothetical protein
LWTVFSTGEHSGVIGHVDVQGPHHISLESVLDSKIKLLVVAAEEIQGPAKIDTVIDINLRTRLVVKVDRDA